MAAATAFLTAFYMFRMYFMTFEGEFRGDQPEVLAGIDQADAQGMPIYAFPKGVRFGPGAMHTAELDHAEQHHEYHAPHESAWAMTTPLVVLAVPSILIGLVGLPWANAFEANIHPPEELAAHGEHVFHLEEFLLVAGVSTFLSLVGIALAYYCYRLKPELPSQLASKVQGVYQFSLRKWYMDDLYDLLFVQGSRNIAKVALANDQKVLDGVVNASGFFTLLTGETLKYFESGRAQFYTLIVFASVVLIVGLLGLL